MASWQEEHIKRAGGKWPKVFDPTDPELMYGIDPRDPRIRQESLRESDVYRDPTQSPNYTPKNEFIEPSERGGTFDDYTPNEYYIDPASTSPLLKVVLAQSQAGDPKAQALLQGLMTQQGLMGPGTGTLDALRRPVVDPETGQRDQTSATTGEIVKRSNLLPVGVNDRGEIRPAGPAWVGPAADLIPHSIESAVKGAKYVGDVAADRKGTYDPTTGHSSAEAADWAMQRALGIQGGGLTTGVGPGGAVLGSGLIRKTASKNLGMGKEGRAAMEAEAAAGGKPLTYWSDLGIEKHRIPVEQMRAGREDLQQLLPRQEVSPEALQGSLLIPAIGDRTIAGQKLLSVNDTPLSNPVSLEGGPNYMRDLAAQGPDNAIWASHKGVLTGVRNNIMRQAEKAKTDDVNLVYTTMGGQSGDYSHMMADALLGQIPSAKITKEALAAFDDAVRAKRPEWKGLNDPDVRDSLLKSGELRKAFVKTMAQSKHADAGFPDVPSTRFAISEPDLINAPIGTSGFAIGKADVGAPTILNPVIPHQTYAAQLPGKGYVGGIEGGIPHDVMWPGHYAARRAAGKEPNPATDWRSFEVGAKGQVADQEWLDTIMKYMAAREGR